MDTLTKIITLSFIQGIGPRKIARILEKNKSLAELENDLEFLYTIGFSSQNFQKWRSTGVTQKVAVELLHIKQKTIQHCHIFSKNYPAILKEIYDFPPLFFYYGELPSDDHFFVAFVGSRKASHYGIKQTHRIIKELASSYNKLVIVSGLAYGIDAVAHQCALDIGVKTIAVLGSGLGSIYPAVHLPLAKKIIAQKGAVLSEFYTKTKPAPQNFPFRNRIISGLSSAVVVMEAALKSGALITARAALEQNREVFALPGNVDTPSYQGSNRLLKQGANLITTGEDILEHFSLQKIIPMLNKESIASKKYSKKEKKILEVLQKTSATVEEITAKTGLDIASVMQLATSLEMGGVIREELGGKYYLVT